MPMPKFFQLRKAAFEYKCFISRISAPERAGIAAKKEN